MTLKLSGNGRFLAANIQNHFIITYEIVPLPFDIARLVGFTLRIEVVVVSGEELFQIVLGLMCPGVPSGGGESQNDDFLPRFGINRPQSAF